MLINVNIVNIMINCKQDLDSWPKKDTCERAKLSEWQTCCAEAPNEHLKPSNPKYHADPCSTNKRNMKLKWCFFSTLCLHVTKMSLHADK